MSNILLDIKEQDGLATIEERILEAVTRMKILDLHPNPINEFAESGVVNYSESPDGILYWLTDEWLGFADSFERRYNSTVFHIIHNYTNIGELLTMLYVSQHKNEWYMDRLMLKDKHYPETYAYVKNLSFPECSEIGSVGLKSVNGGVIRVS